MSVIKQDESQLKKEQQLIDKTAKESNERANYLSALKVSRKFQKYVVKEIFQKIMDDVYSIDNIPISDEPDKVGNITTQYILARKGFKKVIDTFKPL